MNVKKSESLEVIDLLRRAIITGEYKPRERLVEKDLAEKYSVSRTPIREALNHLEALGLVKIERYKGAMVADIDQKELKEMLVVRASLEGLSANLAAGNMSPRDLLRLEECEKAMEQCVKDDDVQQFSICNEEFHEIIHAGSGNQYLYATIMQLLKRSWHEPCSSWKALGDVPLTIRGHQQILSALRARDALGAERAAEQHMYDAMLMAEEQRRRESSMTALLFPVREHRNGTHKDKTKESDPV